MNDSIILNNRFIELNENIDKSLLDKDYLYFIFKDKYIVRLFKFKNKSNILSFTILFSDEKNAIEKLDDLFGCNGFKLISRNQVVDSIFDDIQLGGHSDEFFREQVVDNLLTSFEVFSNMSMKTDENYSFYLKTTYATCQVCGNAVHICLDTENSKIYLNDKIENKNCLTTSEDSSVTVQLTNESGKFVVANDLRRVLKTSLNGERVDFFENVNYDKGREESMIRYSKIDVLTRYVGNTTLDLYEFDDKFILANEYGLDCFNSDIDEETSSGYISTSLWWFMATAIENVNMKALIDSGQNYVVVEAKPNTKAKMYYNRCIDDYIEVDYI